MDLTDLIHELERPEAYPFEPTDVEIRQTHISVVFLADDFVYKIKKPVDYGFLDFTSLDKRRYFCDEEVRLNQRLAPHVYIGVVPVAHRDGQLRFEAEGEAIEWAVKMHRLPDEATLESRLESESDAFDVQWIERLAVRIADFHHKAETSSEISSMANFPAVSKNAKDNFEQSADQVGTTISQTVFDRLQNRNDYVLEQQRALIEWRAETNVPCDTHGDLRLEHVYLFPDRPPPEDLAIIDCIEFSEQFRFADPIADIAFLVMGLHLHGRADLGESLLKRYFDTRNDSDGKRLLPFYIAYRAAVRGKVEGMQSMRSEIDQHDRNLALRKSQAAWLLALSELEPASDKPCCLLIAGLPGTGKSTLAKHLAERANLNVIRSDVVRKELAAQCDEMTADDSRSLYTAQWNRRTYDECQRRAEAILFDGGRVLIDANFRCDADREMFMKTAVDLGVLCLLLICQAEPETVRQRLDHRQGDASDADWSVYLKAAQQWEEPSPLVRKKTVILDTDTTTEETVERACRLLQQRNLLNEPNG